MNISDTHCNIINLDSICIKGELVTAEMQVSVDQLYNLNDDIIDFEKYVKQHLSQILAKSLLDSKQIYFSKLENPKTSRISYMARVSVVPKDVTQEIVKTVKNTPSVRKGT